MTVLRDNGNSNEVYSNRSGKRLPSLVTYELTISQALRASHISQIRGYASAPEKDLKATLAAVIPEKRELFKKVKSHGSKVIGEVKIENTIGGMR